MIDIERLIEYWVVLIQESSKSTGVSRHL